MVRVVSGTRGGLRLKTKDADTTRATLEKVKEAMFDMIMIHIPGALVLDLFSGNGSLGIEALSRGASHCYFNDKDRECVKIIKENLDFTKFNGQSTVFMKDFSECLSELYKNRLKFDIILLDPPYKKGFAVPAVEYIDKHGLGTDNCLIIAESDAAEVFPDEIGNFKCKKKKKYGNTAVNIYGNF